MSTFVDKRGIPHRVDEDDPPRRGGESTVLFATGQAGERVAIKLGDLPDAAWIHAEHALVTRLNEDPSLAEVVVRARGSGWSVGRPFAVYDAHPCSLQEWVPAHPDRAERREMARRIADAVARLHARRPPVLHRDLKPSNVLVAEDGSPRICDFGAAREGRRGATTTTLALFTPGWSPPEVLGPEGGPGAAPAADVFSLAATLFFVLVGHAPVAVGANAAAVSTGGVVERRRLRALTPGDRTALRRATDDEALPTLLARALAPEPTERTVSAADLAVHLASPPTSTWLRAAPRATLLVGALSLMPAAIDARPVVETVAVRAGTYDTLDGPVTLPGPLWVSTLEVTQDAWREVMGEDPSTRRIYDLETVRETCTAWRRRGSRDTTPVSIAGDRFPVVCVDFYDAIRFANALSVREGLTPAYGWPDDDPTAVTWNRAASGWRLPTPAEWWVLADPTRRLPPEQWCRTSNLADPVMSAAVDGLVPPVPCADGFVAASPAGALSPDAWGLFDVLGNVSEWTWDERADGKTSVQGLGWASSLGEPNGVADRRLRWTTLGFRLVRDDDPRHR